MIKTGKKSMIKNIEERLSESLEHLIIIYYHPQYTHMLEERDSFTFQKGVSTEKYHVYEWRLH